MSNSEPCLYRFGPFSVDPDKFVLTRNGSAIALPPKTFETLLVLIHRRQVVIEKTELINLLWPDTFVQEINLTVHISRLRKALGEGPGDHRYIITVPGHGYRFVASVDEIYARDTRSVNPSPAAGDGKVPIEPIGVPDAESPAARSIGPPSAYAKEPAPTSAMTGWLRVVAMSRPKLIAAVAVVAVLASAYLFVHRRKHSGAQDVCRVIAVLPFRSEGGPVDEALAAGMADALTTRLSGLRDLTVKQTSVLASARPREVATDPLAAGRDLGVEAVLDGTLRQSVTGLHLTTRLLRVRDGEPIWTGRFDATPATVMDVQDSICRQLAAVLGLPPRGNDERNRTNNGTRNPAAYESYLRGLYFWNKRTNESLKKAIEYFTSAIGEDAGYAAAYATLADCYYLRAHYNYMSFDEAFPLQKAAATRALELDQNLAQAHMEMAQVISTYEHEPGNAARELQRAVELDPNYPTAHQRYAWMLVRQGKLDQALPEMERAVDLDPLSVINNSALAALLYFSGQYDAAIECCRKALEFDPGSTAALHIIGLVHMQQGRFEQALPELEQAERDDAGSVETLGTLGNAYAMAGRKATARKYIEKLQQMSRSWANPLYGIAIIYAGMGDRDRSLAWLERAARSDGLPEYFPRFDPRLAFLRADPRFENIIRMMDQQGPNV
jgi:DNA-binding winged helix-turn-helix (wHTH) protein/tetratricopeptide (TPR) repeat protein/TolB-like protein